MRQESITATPMLSVTTLTALTIVHANQDILETAFTAQVEQASENPQPIALNNMIGKHFYSTNFFEFHYGVCYIFRGSLKSVPTWQHVIGHLFMVGMRTGSLV